MTETEQKQKRMRQSLMGSADICLKRAGYDLVGDDKNTSESRIVGTAYHGGLEAYYRMRWWGQRPTWDDARTGALNAFVNERDLYQFSAWDTSQEEAWDKVEGMLRAYIDNGHAWPEDHRVLAVEQPFDLPLVDGWLLHGTIDLVIADPAGNVILEDHKTAKRKWPREKGAARKSNQAVVYSYAWQRLTGQEATGFTFAVMTHRGEFERRWTKATPHMIDEILKKAWTLTVLLQLPVEQLPPTTDHNLCSAAYCDHWDRCPMGAAASY
ncbi:MAG TPA: PD-(D/E)XK nuclease family protein [Acidimicrobiales bacterium]|nr:PD-(D/E)XK nuclease family protein [Acidimicrobiales bacterium]